MHCTKNEFSIKDFFSKCDQIRRKLRIWSHLLKKSLMENFIFCAVLVIIFFSWSSLLLSLYLNAYKIVLITLLQTCSSLDFHDKRNNQCPMRLPGNIFCSFLDFRTDLSLFPFLFRPQWLYDMIFDVNWKHISFLDRMAILFVPPVLECVWPLCVWHLKC